MRLVVAPDAYKGCASEADVAAAMARGIRRVFPDADIRELPVADGGEGTLDALIAATHGERRVAQVCDPLGRPMAARGAFLATDEPPPSKWPPHPACRYWRRTSATRASRAAAAPEN